MSMRSVVKILKVVVIAVVFILLAVLVAYYAPNKSLEELQEKWTYDNSQFINIDGMPVHHRINGEGMPLVLIHGTAASLHTWERWTEILDDHYKVISLDIPAFGLTGPNSDGNYSLEFYARFLHQFLQELEVDSMYLAGNSLGGAIAWRYTTMYPKEVKKLILVDASGYPSNKETPLAFKLARSKIWRKALLNFTPKSLFRTSLEAVYYDDELVSDELIQRYYDLYLREGNRQAFVDRVNNFTPIDPLLIKTISVPTLIQWGKADEWISVENALKFKRDIPNSKVIIYENTGHVPMEEKPEITANDCLEFLQAIDDGV